MIIALHEKYDVNPDWFEEQVKSALTIGSPAVVEILSLPRLCELLMVYRINDEAGASEAALRMKALLDLKLIDEAME